MAAYDGRGHGATRAKNETDLSVDRLTEDAGEILAVVSREVGKNTRIVLVGHSAGASIVVHLADSLKDAAWADVVGVAALDMVGGTALQIADGIEAYLRTRPASFSSLREAVCWSVRSGFVTNPRSAALSIPGCLIQTESNGRWTWRTDVLASKTHWTGWFARMSPTFLKLRASKLLILTGIGRLDTELTVAQMQGKFALKILRCGHMVHENAPGAVFDAIEGFVDRSIQIASLRKRPVDGAGGGD